MPARRCPLALSLASALALASVAPARAQEPARLRPDTAAASGPDRLRARASPDSATLRLGLEQLGPIFPRLLPAAPGSSALWLRPRLSDWTAAWAAAARRHAAARVGLLTYASPPADTLPSKAAPDPDCCKGFLPPPARRGAPRQPALLPGAVANYADIGMRIRGRTELGSAWTRYYPCDPTMPALCNPTLYPQLKPDVQLGVEVGGTISDRVHVDVDYDQRREFDAANNINVYYQGLPDEVLQRLEVGDVSIRLPQSRYLTQGIPAGNFGFKAIGQLGPMDFQAVWAQQKGDVSKREFHLNGGAGQTAGLVQDASITLDDGAYVKGQFFFVVDPDSLRGYPHINALQLQLPDAPPGSGPAPGTLVVYRDERISPSSQAQVGQLGYFMASAVARFARDSVVHTGVFRRLQPGQDYIVHSSGLWIALRSPLRDDEALAIGYISERGDTVGSINADAQRTGKPTLRLLRGPVSVHQPGAPTWPLEMHQVYRIDASSGVDVSSVGLTISLGQLSGGKTFALAAGRQITYLKLLGLDELPPADALDGAQIYQPTPASAAAAAGAGAVSGTFVVFPTLQPFETPPPVPSAGLSAADAAAALGTDANRDIYENPDPVARDAATRFRLNFSYRVTMGGMLSTLQLGALGIREGSEKIYVGDRQLENGKDYTIDYDVGAVTLLNPQSVYGGNPNADIRATWEQKAMFQLAPTSIFGVNTRYRLGSRGELNLVGLYQSEKTLMARPELGTEPSSIFLGGASGKLELGGAALDALLSRVPGLRYDGHAAVSLSGEAALSSPNPNTKGAAYLDDFEAGDETPISLTRQSWHLGSKPAYTTGAEQVFPAALDKFSAMRLVWQHDINDNGQVTGSLAPKQIDANFNVNGLGGQLGQTVLYLSLGGDTIPEHQVPERRWRSLTTVLSTTGRDLSRAEYLELYVEPPASDNSAALVLDLGTVSEDAFYYNSRLETHGLRSDGTPWGEGELDQEVDLSRHQIWGVAADSAGLWDQECHAERGSSYPVGDARANCTRGNGLIDTEDLNGNGVLDGEGTYFRYVIDLGGASPYLVRDQNATKTGFRLYRIPLRGSHVVAVNGANDATWRFIQHLRLTVVDSAGGTARKVMRIARMGLVGSRWAKRDLAGLEQGLTDVRPAAGDTSAVQVGPVSSLTDDGYASPPGIVDQLQDPTAQFAVGTAQIINEKSLRLAIDHLAPNTRAEVYFRYPQQPRSFLNYRQLRLWAVARQGTWGRPLGERLLVKVGSDESNYYIYQTRLNPAFSGPMNRTGGEWLPEIAIDFTRWFALRAQAETMLVQAGPGTGPLVVWDRDSTYGIVLQDRARAPNLAAVRELSFAVYNGGPASETSELWLDDLRLSGALTDPGFAGNLNVAVRAGDFLSASASVASQGALFHQLNQEASYQRTGDASVSGIAQLGLMAPAAWDLDAPLSFSWGKSGLVPQFLAGTDIPTTGLPNLRSSGSNRLRVDLALRRRTPAANPLLGLIVDGLALRVGYTGASQGTATSLDRSSGVDGALVYDRRPSAREFGVMPGFLKDALQALFPARLEQGDLFRRLTGARLRWTPEALSFSTAYYNQRSDAFRYDQILRLDGDTLPPISSARRGLDNNARLALHPFASLTAAISLGSTRDLLPAARASDQLLIRKAIEAAQGGVGGLPLGWESNRNISTQLDWRPVLAAWLRPGFSFSGQFRANRNPSLLQVVPAPGDSLFADTAAATVFMQRQFQADRQVTRSLQVDAGGLLRALRAAPPRLLAGAGRALQPVELSWTSALSSAFDRMPRGPGSGYQLGLGSAGAWRFIGPDTATTLNSRTGFRGRTGIALPLGTQLTASYDRGHTSLLDLRGGQRTEDSHTWPALQLAWAQIPLPAVFRSVLTQMSASGGYQHTTRSSVYGMLDAASAGGSGAATGFLGRGADDESSIPVQLALGLIGTLRASYNGSFGRGTLSDPTGVARTSASTHALTLSGFFKAPPSLRDRFPKPVQATLGLSRQGDSQCRLDAMGDACTPFVDYTMRRVNISLDTELSQLTVGFQMSYNSRRSNIGTLNGSSQFQLGIFGQFNLTAGQFQGSSR